MLYSYLVSYKFSRLDVHFIAIYRYKSKRLDFCAIEKNYTDCSLALHNSSWTETGNLLMVKQYPQGQL